MGSVLFTIGGAVTNALALSGTNFFFSKLTDHGAKERKRYGLTLDKLQRNREKWDKVFESGPSKVCGRQPLKILRGYGLLK